MLPVLPFDQDDELLATPRSCLFELFPNGFDDWIDEPSRIESAFGHCVFFCKLVRMLSGSNVSVRSGFDTDPGVQFGSSSIEE